MKIAQYPITVSMPSNGCPSILLSYIIASNSFPVPLGASSVTPKLVQPIKPQTFQNSCKQQPPFPTRVYKYLLLCKLWIPLGRKNNVGMLDDRLIVGLCHNSQLCLLFCQLIAFHQSANSLKFNVNVTHSFH